MKKISYISSNKYMITFDIDTIYDLFNKFKKQNLTSNKCYVKHWLECKHLLFTDVYGETNYVVSIDEPFRGSTWLKILNEKTNKYYDIQISKHYIKHKIIKVYQALIYNEKGNVKNLLDLNEQFEILERFFPLHVDIKEPCID